MYIEPNELFDYMTDATYQQVNKPVVAMGPIPPATETLKV